MVTDTLYVLPDTLTETQAELLRAERLADICRRNHDRDGEVCFRNRMARLRLHGRQLEHDVLGRGFTQNGGFGGVKYGEPVAITVERTK